MGMGSVNPSGFWPITEGINEIVATTELNAAPMGIIRRDGAERIGIFRTSHTATNIENHPFFIANIIHDPVVFVRTAFSDLPAEEFTVEYVNGEKLYRLAAASSWIAYAATIETMNDLKILVRLEPLRYVAAEAPLIPVNRGFSNLIEAAVHGTRYQLSPDRKLLELITHHADLVRRCGGNREREALDLLYRFLRLD
jgi:hypothetical protein